VTGLDGRRQTGNPSWDTINAANVGDYRLQVSPDGSTGWTDVAVKVNPIGAAVSAFRVVLEEPVTGRYFRILVDFTAYLPTLGSGYASGFARVNQFELYGEQVDPRVDVVSVDAVAGVEADEGAVFGDLGLPAQVGVTLSTGNRANVPVVWDEAGYGGVPGGVYELTGALSLAGILENPGSLAASVEVTVGGEPPGLDLALAVAPRCVAGKVTLAVTAVNLDESVAASLLVVSPFVSKSFPSVAPQGKASQAVAAKQTTIAAGVVTVTGVAAGDESRTGSASYSYPSFTCGAG
jgi:hypothetical protein